MTLIPISENHKDVVFTPDEVARDIVAHFSPTGTILEPSKGDGAFLKYMPTAAWCEIREGKDFFDWSAQVDWIVGNPPYSIFAEWLYHSFEVANNIVYLLPVNKVFNSNNMLRLIYSWGGIKEIYVIGHGSIMKTEKLGFAIGAIHLQRNYTGSIVMSFRNAPPNTASSRLFEGWGDLPAGVNQSESDLPA